MSVILTSSSDFALQVVCKMVRVFVVMDGLDLPAMSNVRAGPAILAAIMEYAEQMGCVSATEVGLGPTAP